MSDEDAEIGRGRSKFQNERGGGGGGGGRSYPNPNTYGEYKKSRGNDGYNGPPPHRRNSYRDRSQYEPPGKRQRFWDHDDRAGGRGGGGGERVRKENDQPGFQPSMMTFKAFLANQDDTITDEDAMTKYGEYKAEFKRQQLNEFYVSHKAEEWFKERFHPVESDRVRLMAEAGRARRAQVFWEVYDQVNQIRLDADLQDELVTLMDVIVIKLEGGSDDQVKEYLEKRDDIEEDIVQESTTRKEPIVEKKPEFETETKIEKNNLSKFDAEGSQSDSGEIDDEKEKSVDDVKDVKENSVDNVDDEKEESVEDIDDGSNDDSNITKSSGANIEDDLELSGEDQGSDELEEEVPQMDGNDTLNKAKGAGGEAEKDVASTSVDCVPSEDVDLASPVGLEKDSLLLEDDDPTAVKEISMVESPASVPQLDGAQDDVDLTTDLAVDPNSVAPPLTTPEPLEATKPLRKNLQSTVSIHLRNIPPAVTKAELESVCCNYAGFLRVALSDPAADRKWSRRGWVTFSKGSNVKEICCSLSGARLGGVELGPVINRELSKRVRLVAGLVSDKKVVRNNIKLASKIVQNMDKKWGLDKDLGGDKLMENIADYLIEEASAEEDELLGVSREEGEAEEGGMVMVQREEELMGVLDKLIMYLRVVHSVDFYNHSEYPYEDQMPNRLGLIHARGPVPVHKVAQTEIDQHLENFEKKIGGFLSVKEDLSDKEVLVLGGKVEDEEVDKFMQSNCQEVGKDKWLCPLSGKKFKGPEFIKKHIVSKFMDRVEQVKADVQYFNRYLKDPKRPQLQEKPKVSRPSSGGGGRRHEGEDRPGSGGGYREATSYPVYHERGRGGWDRPPPHHQRGGGGHRGWGGGSVRDRVGHNARGGNDRPDPRAMIDYSDVDFPMDW